MTETVDGAGDSTGTARVLARCALAAAAAAVVLLLTGFGAGGLLILVSGLVGLVASAAGIWWFLAHRGAVRVLGALLAVGAPVVVLTLYVVWGLALNALLALCLWGVAVGCAREAQRLPEQRRGDRSRTDGARVRRRSRPRRAVLIMNPKSGGGKVGRFGLVERAEKLGARVILIDPSVETDVAALAREAVADGADLLGVAGGDGTQALVAAVAAEHDLPFLVISAGTRNHFALDLGLDREDPARCLDALSDGEELRVDLGSVSGRPFVNTVSFGVYADVVQRPEYRDAKAGTALDVLPDLLQGGQGARLDATADAVRLPAQQALLVSNNPYAAPDPFGAAAARRPRLDGGELGVIAVRVDGAADAADLVVRGTQSAGLNVMTAGRVEVSGRTPAPAEAGAPFAWPSAVPVPETDLDTGSISVAVDGEALVMPTPVVCTLRPRALRVLVPRHRPGSPPPSRPLDWRRVTALAFPDHFPSTLRDFRRNST
ncbi:diacylglycerol/lipid kinase family protein [Streptomyces sp. NPDC048330]|uniref:diacylglycerol/lipid kinase family protein n=1 Tax=Streptomyces sp. NPDC048330 TaxID=3365533 RepID=UPI003713E13B